jgi:transcriptional regulator
VTHRRLLLELVSSEPRTLSSLSRELGLDKRGMEDDLRHMIRSALAAGHDVIVEPARCRSCGFLFDEDRLTKPGKCPSCRGSRILEPLIRVVRQQ